MEIFEGSVEGFIEFFGTSYFTNLIQRKTKRHKKLGMCEGFGKPPHISAQPEAAHLHGRERITIIREVISKYKNKDNMIRCDLHAVANEIWAAHLPIEDTFKFLCADCHEQYHKAERPVTGDIDKSIPMTTSSAPSKPSIPSKKSPVSVATSRWASNPRLRVHRIIAIAATHHGHFSREWLVREIDRRKISSNSYGAVSGLMTNTGNNYGLVFVKQAGGLTFHPDIVHVIHKHNWRYE